MAKPLKDRPRYLFDTLKWEIRLYDDCWNERGDELKKFGYGAISYSWNKWMDRRPGQTVKPGTTTGTGSYPTFGVQNVSWEFPIVRKDPNNPVDDPQQPSDAQFTMQDVQQCFNRMGKRFVWWDWACIPQGQAPGLSDELVKQQNEEMNKMRYVYPNSSRGIIWAHSVTWGTNSALETAIRTCTQYLATQPNPKTVVDANAVIKALEDVNRAEPWLASLWCFQEGVLFSHPNRPGSESDSVFRDHSGASLPVEAFPNEGDLIDLVAVASGIGATILNAIRNRAEGRVRQPQSNPKFIDWLFDPANEIDARAMMDRLVATGLVFFMSRSPLSLLNARYSRSWFAWTKKRDVEVDTIIGALEVDIAAYLVAPAPGNLSQQQRSDYDAAKLATERAGMLTELFKIYQWRMLLFAVGDRPTPGQVTPIWSSLAEARDFPVKTQLPYASIEYFCITVHLSERFKPPPPLREGEKPPPLVPPAQQKVPEDQFALPRLEYTAPVDGTQYLVVGKLDGFKAFDLSGKSGPVKAPTKCMFYAYPGEDEGRYVPAFKLIDSGDAFMKHFGNDGVLFIPVENLSTAEGDEWAKKPRLRCAVVTRFGKTADLKYPIRTPTSLAGTFIGIADLEGWTATDGNMKLENDVTVY